MLQEEESAVGVARLLAALQLFHLLAGCPDPVEGTAPQVQLLFQLGKQNLSMLLHIFVVVVVVRLYVFSRKVAHRGALSKFTFRDPGGQIAHGGV